MKLLAGAYDSTLDSKGRFQLPTVFLQEFIPTETEVRFVINRSSEKCLTLFPMNIWNVYVERLGKINTFDPKNRRAVRYFMGDATEVKLDSKNRLLIPKTLQEYASLEKDLRLVSLPTFIEIWNPELYKETFDKFVVNEEDTIREVANFVFNDGKFFEDIPDIP
ncbi:MAG: division/cell wall cluster transcriptional repressor MraZ [Bacteroidales bacterium]|jgi:MraZ protein|nr:division/cell wall cluster transcriptional repressor MraZ [Bacteroidales bacterium]